MAIERTETGRMVFVCDSCADLGIDRAWLRRAGLKGLPENCSGPQKHVRWDYRAKDARRARAKKARDKRKAAKKAARAKPAPPPNGWF